MPIGNIGRYTDATRHYVRLNDGSIVTRSTAENMFAQSKEGGRFTNQYARKRAYASQAFKDAKASKHHATNSAEARAHGTSQREFDALTAKMMQNPNDKSPNGPLADWLVATGRRSAGETYPVGDSIYL